MADLRVVPQKAKTALRSTYSAICAGLGLQAVWTGERVQAWQRDFDAALAAARAAGGRVSPIDIWVSTPRPSPVMVWTPAQTMVLLDAASRHRLHALWRLYATRGLRRGEGYGLRRPDTDLGAGLSTIRWQITQLGWDPVQGVPKSDAGERTVALDADTVTDLATWRQEQDTEKQAAEDAGSAPGSSSPTRWAIRCTPPRSLPRSTCSTTSPGCRPSGCMICVTGPPPCCWLPGTT